MRGTPPVTMEFAHDGQDWSAIHAAMQELADTADGRRFMNLTPAVDEAEVPTGSSLFGIFSARGPIIPLGTWTPGHQTRRGYEHSSLGLRHGTGRDTVDRLARHGAPVPEGWVVFEDHPKHGLILYIPPEVTVVATLAACVAMVAALTPFATDGRWRAEFHRP